MNIIDDAKLYQYHLRCLVSFNQHINETSNIKYGSYVSIYMDIYMNNIHIYIQVYLYQHIVICTVSILTGTLFLLEAWNRRQLFWVRVSRLHRLTGDRNFGVGKVCPPRKKRRLETYTLKNSRFEPKMGGLEDAVPFQLG